MVSHYDVVDVTVYGDIAEHAFDADKLGEIFGADEDTLYGRGVMDMKCGVALEAALLEDAQAALRSPRARGKLPIGARADPRSRRLAGFHAP